ncbi:hypothetical protein EV182_004361 [Spiromyces aspiralis]|uniref:Uncharacterized protein n=1 Tax=Spiromyces aspiralis TaxID=68401 RepID=A0ACC1HDV1_9FUNG|nr:hypothetical protein EV182_004361 [Spiromyces aspiralis]
MLPAALAVAAPTLGAAATLAYFYRHPNEDARRGGGYTRASNIDENAPMGFEARVDSSESAGHTPIDALGVTGDKSYQHPRNLEALQENTKPNMGSNTFYEPERTGKIRQAMNTGESPASTNSPSEGLDKMIDPLSSTYDNFSSSTSRTSQSSSRSVGGEAEQPTDSIESHLRGYRNEFKVNREYGINLAHNIGLKHKWSSPDQDE